MSDTILDTAPAVTHAARPNLYAGIHKALRLLMTDTLTRVGAADPDDTAQLQPVLAQVDQLLTICQVHLDDENRFVHPALERAAPGSASRIGGEHREHAEHIEHLRELRSVVEATAGAGRAAALARLYAALAVFVGENFVHMQYEETEHNAVLWAHYSDDELMAIEGEIVAHLPPGAMEAMLPWFLLALSAPERAGMLLGMRAGMPPEVFQGVLGLARERLVAGEFAKLDAALSAAR